MNPALCLLNPHAAGGRCAALAEPLRQALRSVPLFLPDDVASARARLLALPEGSRVIVAGGDGTVHQLLPALVERRHELALLPGGTGNDLARALGLRGLSLNAALAHAMQAPARAIDLGAVQIGERHNLFMSSLTAGFDAAIATRAQAAPAWLRGMPRYLWATLAEIGRLRLYPLTLEIDGQRQPGAEMLFASSLNTGTYASGMPVAPGAKVDDGRLQLVQVGRFGRLGALLTMPLLLTGLHLRHPRIRMTPYQHLRISSPQPIALALDGEPIADAAGLDVRVMPRALRVVARC